MLYRGTHAEPACHGLSSAPIRAATCASWCLLLVAACLAAAAPGYAQDRVYAAAEVKAAFLYHFGTYVQWRDTARLESITIAVLGADGVAAELARFLPGRMIHGLPARVERVRSVDELTNERILFIGAGENARLREHIEAVGRRPVLIVTDAPDGLDAGAMVNFRIVERQVQFEVSVPAAEAAGLMLSSRLLSAAMHVETARWPEALPFPDGGDHDRRRRLAGSEHAPSVARMPAAERFPLRGAGARVPAAVAHAGPHASGGRRHAGATQPPRASGGTKPCLSCGKAG